ncbi:hypothetical protein L0152_17200 [bacterium]|nr:hypothetical protein [bacterium]
MRVRWEESKRKQVLQKRKIDFRNLEDLFCLHYIEDQRLDHPEQYRVIGFAAGRITSFVVEYREDDFGEFIWVVTAWKSTKQEREIYEKETR